MKNHATHACLLQSNHLFRNSISMQDKLLQCDGNGSSIFCTFSCCHHRTTLTRFLHRNKQGNKKISKKHFVYKIAWWLKTHMICRCSCSLSVIFFLHCQVKSWEHKSLQGIKNELKFASQTADLFLARWPAKWIILFENVLLLCGGCK